MKSILISLCTTFYIFTLIAGPQDKLKELNQSQLLDNWDKLSAQEQADLTAQIERLDILTFRKQQETALNSVSSNMGEISPFEDYFFNGSEKDAESGKKIIAEGQVGCLIVAGGQGTRLKYNGPKGSYPITNIKNKSLFQFVAEKVRAASIQNQRPLLMAIMTSPGNHQETIAHFENHQYFGLNSNQVFFYSQEELPFIDQKGNLFLETHSKIAAGPDGNAASLKNFVDKGVWAAWRQKGIRYVLYLHIDNPLADPFDAELIGFHKRQEGTDMIVKCITRDDPLEKLGVILRVGGQTEVIEYSEISPEERDARKDNGKLKHLCGNISLFSFTMDFIKNIADNQYNKLPLHKAWKASNYLTLSGDTKMSESPIAWKFERFIFDVLPYAQKVKTLMYPREDCFAPLKNATGSDSIADVQKALQNYDRKVMTKITGVSPSPTLKFELDPQFYYPTNTILTKWKGKVLDESSYIEP